MMKQEVNVNPVSDRKKLKENIIKVAQYRETSIFSFDVGISKENPEYLRAAVESVLGQTVPPEEVELVCDGPLTEALGRVIAGVCEAGNCFS